MSKGQLLTTLLGTALLVGTFSVLAAPADAQMQPMRTQALSPGARQTLVAILQGFPANDRQLVLNAIWQLGPERAEAQLAQIRAMPAPTVQALGTMVLQALQALPTQYHPAFINGLFEVSPMETQFANQVLTQIGQATIQMNSQNAEVFAAGQEAKRRTDNATICALGPGYCRPWKY
jgi:hypothetical protein